jgi:hypothetical protein
VTSWCKMKRLLNARFLPPDDYGIQRKPVRYPYVDQLCDDDVSHLHKSPNRPFAYEEKFDYGKGVNMVTRVELPSKKKYAQPPPLFPMEEQLLSPPPQEQPPTPQEQPPLPHEQPSLPKEQPFPPQEQILSPYVQSPSPSVQLITFTTKGDDSYEENSEVEKDNHKRTNGEILLEVEEKEKSSLGEIYIDFSKSISVEQPRVIRHLTIVRQWKYKKRELTQSRCMTIKLSTRNVLMESEAQQVAKPIGGVRLPIQDEVPQQVTTT